MFSFQEVIAEYEEIMELTLALYKEARKDSGSYNEEMIKSLLSCYTQDKEIEVCILRKEIDCTAFEIWEDKLVSFVHKLYDEHLHSRLFGKVYVFGYSNNYQGIVAAFILSFSLDGKRLMIFPRFILNEVYLIKFFMIFKDYFEENNIDFDVKSESAEDTRILQLCYALTWPHFVEIAKLKMDDNFCKIKKKNPRSF